MLRRPYNSGKGHSLPLFFIVVINEKCVHFFLKGGTIDITAHQLMENCNVKEIIGATGGDWGGTRVDKESMISSNVSLVKQPQTISTITHLMYSLKL